MFEIIKSTFIWNKRAVNQVQFSHIISQRPFQPYNEPQSEDYSQGNQDYEDYDYAPRAVDYEFGPRAAGLLAQEPGKGEIISTHRLIDKIIKETNQSISPLSPKRQQQT